MPPRGYTMSNHSPPEVIDVDDDTFAAWCRLYESRPVDEFNAAPAAWAEITVLREDGNAPPLHRTERKN